MKKTVFSICLALSILLTGIKGAYAATVNYKDVKPEDNYYKAVENLMDQKAISRTLPYFRPNDLVTRGQAASILVKVLGISIENVKDPGFKDVPKNHQFYKYIAALENKGIIGGKGDGTFGINQPLTRGQMSAILVKGFDIPLIGIHDVGYNGFDDTVNYAGGEGENSIADGDTVAAFNGQFAQAIETMHYYDYISGYKSIHTNGYVRNEFKQGNPIKRSQLALMIEKIQKGTNYQFLYFKDFNIINYTEIDHGEKVTDRIKIDDTSIITFANVSNYIEQGLLDGTFRKEYFTNEYATLLPKKEGTTLIRFEGNNPVIEIKVERIKGKLKATFKAANSDSITVIQEANPDVTVE